MSETEALKFLASEIREYSQGNIDVDHKDIKRHAVLVDDPKLRRVMSFRADAYDPLTDDMPSSYWETKEARSIIEIQGTDVASKAVQNGNVAVLDYLSGLVSYNPDISGIRALMWLQNALDEDAPMFQLLGHMGSGKSNFALLMIEVWLHVHRNGVVISNIRSLSVDQSEKIYCNSAEHLVELTEEIDRPKLLLVDEASSNWSGYSGDAHKVEEQVRRLSRMLRKRNCGLVTIGHTGKDIHPDLRRLSIAVEKVSQKKAVFYKDVDSNGGGEGEIKTLTGIPETELEYNDDEESTWTWDLDVSEDDGEDIEDDYGRCKAFNRHGDRCGNDAIDDHGYCHNHRHKADSDEEETEEEV